MMKRLAKILLEGAGYQLVKRNTLQKSLYKNMDSSFAELHAACAPYTMTSVERMYALYNGIKYLVSNAILGDIVECGVWKGGSSMLCAMALQKLGETDRKLYLYDTFSGMAEPRAHDTEQFTGEAAHDAWKERNKNGVNTWCFATLDEVKKNMLDTGYPEENIIFVKGKVEDTIPETLPEQIALLRLDTDWYESTAHEMAQLYPKLCDRGVLILDDYGYWSGAKKAVDEYFRDKGDKLLLHRIDTTGRIAVKP